MNFGQVLKFLYLFNGSYEISLYVMKFGLVILVTLINVQLKGRICYIQLELWICLRDDVGQFYC